MKKFWEKLTDILSIVCAGSFIIGILSFIALIIVVCLGYADFDSVLFSCIYSVCICSWSFYGIILISWFIYAKSPKRRIINALQELDNQLAEEEKLEEPFENFNEKSNDSSDDAREAVIDRNNNENN